MKLSPKLGLAGKFAAYSLVSSLLVAAVAAFGFAYSSRSSTASTARILPLAVSAQAQDTRAKVAEAFGALAGNLLQVQAQGLARRIDEDLEGAMRVAGDAARGLETVYSSYVLLGDFAIGESLEPLFLRAESLAPVLGLEVLDQMGERVAAWPLTLAPFQQLLRPDDHGSAGQGHQRRDVPHRAGHGSTGQRGQSAGRAGRGLQGMSRRRRPWPAPTAKAGQGVPVQRRRRLAVGRRAGQPRTRANPT